MKKLLILCSFLVVSVLSFTQTQTIQITGPSATSGPVVVTLEINAPTVCSVSLLPTSITINTSGTQQFTATTLGCSPSTVFYQVNGVTGGDATNGTITGGGLYTAPASVPTPATVTVTAVSNADNTKTASSSVTIVTPPPPCSVSVTPLSATVMIPNTQQFTATTIGCTPNTVTWNVNGVVGGNSTVGTVSGTGLYTTPANVPTPSQVTVQAVSNADGTKTASGVVTVTAPLVCGVSITPQQFTVNVNATDQFAVTTINCSPSTVTWSVNNINGGNSTVGTINGSGLYTAPASVPSPATVTVKATSNADATKSASSSITITTVTISNNDRYCSPGNVPSFGGPDSFGNPPKTCWYTNPSVVVTPGVVHIVTAANWNTTVVNCGDIVEIAAGTTIVGSFNIGKACDAGHWIRLTTTANASEPPYGTKISPCYNNVASMPGRPTFITAGCPTPVAVMASIQTPNTKPPLKLNINTSYFEMDGIVLTRTTGPGQLPYFVDLTAGGINHYIFEHDILQGQPGNETSAGIAVDHTVYGAMKDSATFDIHCISVSGSCTDAKVIAGGGNTNAAEHDNTFSIVNDYFEAAAQCILFGGASTTNNITDIELRSLDCYKPQTWNPSSLTYNGGVGGHAYVVKNGIELKTGIRVFMEGIVIQNVWGGFSQVGEAFAITPKNQAGNNGTNICPLCQVSDVIIRYSKANTVCQGYQIANVASDNGGFANGGFNYSFHDVVFDNMNPPGTGTTNCQSSTPTLDIFESNNAPSNNILHNVDISNNTFVRTTGGTVPGGAILLSGAQFATGNNMSSIKFNNNVIMYGQFFATSNAGNGNTSCNFGQVDAAGVIANCISFPSFTGNAFVNNRPAITWPAGNCTSITTQAAMFANYNNGNGGDYTIQAPCATAGIGGTMPGANLSKVATYTAGVNSF